MKKSNKGNDPEHIQVLDKVEFGLRVRKKREALQMTKATLAEKIGSSVETISNIEGAHKGTTLNRLLRLSIALETSPNYLLAVADNDAEDKEKTAKIRNIVDFLSERDVDELESVERILNLYIDELQKIKR